MSESATFLLAMGGLVYAFAAMASGSYLASQRNWRAELAVIAAVFLPASLLIAGLRHLLWLRSDDAKRQRRLERKRRELEMMREERELDEQIDRELDKLIGDLNA